MNSARLCHASIHVAQQYANLVCTKSPKSAQKVCGKLDFMCKAVDVVRRYAKLPSFSDELLLVNFPAKSHN